MGLPHHPRHLPHAELVVLARAVKAHAADRVFPNGDRAVVLDA